MIENDNRNSFLDQNSNDNTKKPQDDIKIEEQGRIWVGIEDKIEQYYMKKYRQRTMLKIACSLLLIGLISFYIYKFSDKNDISSEHHAVTITPGSDKAILTLEDGSQVDLTSGDQDELAEAGVEFVKSEDGQLIYKISALNEENSIKGFNTITTPRGGQYRIILPDDSEVLLNASSSLRFSKNIGNESIRSVDLTGEGFFKVKKSKIKPFIVNTHGQKIQVLGTVFNVNTYNKSGVYTTLLEGSVRLNDNSILKPGQQGVSKTNKEYVTISDVEVNDYVDWVNKQFVFRDEKIVDIMERLSRWYDFDVVYAANVDMNVTFNGEVSRYTDVEDVLRLLSKTSNLKFVTQGKSIIIK